MEYQNSTETEETEQRPYRVRLPGFIPHEAVGLGDVVQRAAYAVGIKPCGGCERRAAAMNRWMVFTR
jgi:hypothetical protein